MRHSVHRGKKKRKHPGTGGGGEFVCTERSKIIWNRCSWVREHIQTLFLHPSLIGCNYCYVRSACNFQLPSTCDHLLWYVKASILCTRCAWCAGFWLEWVQRDRPLILDTSTRWDEKIFSHTKYVNVVVVIMHVMFSIGSDFNFFPSRSPLRSFLSRCLSLCSCFRHHHRTCRLSRRPSKNEKIPRKRRNLLDFNNFL